MSIAREILEFYQLLYPENKRSSLSISRTAIDMGKQLIQSQLGEDIPKVVFNFNCFDSCWCPFTAYSDSVDSDMEFNPSIGKYYASHSSEYTFDGFEVYRNKEKVLALFSAFCIYCQKDQGFKNIFAHFCLAHYFDMYKAFVEEFYNISINQRDIHNEALLWVLDIFIQYLDGNGCNFFAVESLFSEVTNSTLRDNFKLEAREQMSLRHVMEQQTRSIFNYGSASNKSDMIKVLDKICQIIKMVELDHEVIDYILGQKPHILLGLNNLLGADYYNTKEVSDFIKICNGFVHMV